MNKKIIDLYKRRQKAHDELLACDVKLDMMLRKKSIPEITIKEKLIEKNIYLKLEKEECDFNAFADKSKLNEIFLNLIGNAIKFTKRGGVTIHIIERGKDVKVQITDTGMGIDKKDHKRLFKKYLEDCFS